MTIERYRTFVREDGNRVIWLDQPDYRFPPHSHRRDEHDDDVFVIRAADVDELADAICYAAGFHLDLTTTAGAQAHLEAVRGILRGGGVGQPPWSGVDTSEKEKKK